MPNVTWSDYEGRFAGRGGLGQWTDPKQTTAGASTRLALPPNGSLRSGVAVSEENVELVRSIYALWSSGESARHLIDPDLEYVNPTYAVEPGVRQSRGSLGKIREVYSDFRVEPELFVDAGEHVVVIGVARGTSSSGVEAQWRQGYVWTVRDGKAIRFRWFNQPSEALKAVGLEK